MPLPANLDEYSRYIVMNDDELKEERISPAIVQRIHRLRGLYAYWLQFPDKFERDILQQDIALFGVGRAQAYDDVRLVQIILGNMQQANRNFMRWKINQDLEQDLKAARRQGDYRSVAQLEKVRVLNNRTDKEDEPQTDYDRIPLFGVVMTSNPAALKIEGYDNEALLRKDIDAMNKRYSREIEKEKEYTDYEEVEEDGAAGTDI
ncbi:MAG: hypothetical protein IJK46_05945 [Prevotella sp.]|nr:hypothetical protein [Prevotella sp.]